ncbi:MAG: restriction endonuclease subunit M [Bacteroidales bacterium]|nr:restriction endonuclease subunit M [Bacteroidales bacterium]
MPISAKIDIQENDFLRHGREVLETLLLDHTTGRNILWGTEDYASRGDGYHAADEITVEKITGANRMLIQPRSLKSAQAQKSRVRDKAEVFTPAWVCNAQNNLIDEAWFGRSEVFNKEFSDHAWVTNHNNIEFPEGKTWHDYVRDTRLEITCGEAPYLASRYDAVTGEIIPVEERVGLLDRKLRIVGENEKVHKEWLRWARIALQNTYGFEWQGDNLLLARFALMDTLKEYHDIQFPNEGKLRTNVKRLIAQIISWNLWQMDGLTGQVIMSPRQTFDPMGLNDNSVFCKIRQWGDTKHGRKHREIYFVSLLNK